MLTIASLIIREAGQVLRDRINELQVVDVNYNKDLKSKADSESENLIISKLKKSSHYPILTEESGIIGELKEEVPYWIVDPLDGTMNYTRNFPMYCVSIALWKEKNPLLGVVYDFNRNELYSAIVSDGARMNEESISVSETSSVEQGILATGFPSYRSYKTEPLNNFIKKVQVFKKIRMIGSAAMSLAYVASGRFDAYFEEDIMIWDVAAGLALVKAAGGEIYIKPGSRKHSVICAATNGKIPITELVH